jgi:polar amino acid transport system substrate-binding protein
MGDYYAFRMVYALGSVDCYYAFSRDVSNAIVTSFQQALDALKAEKGADGITAYERIAGRYIPSIGLANLHYLTEDWAPYNYLENGTAAGLSVDMLEAIFNALGVDRGRANVSVVPLADALQQAKGPNSTVVFSIVKSPAREPLYKWAGPFTKSSFVLYARQDSNISITAPEQLNNYRIGAVASTIENQLLADLGVQASNVVNGAAPRDLLDLLENRSVDLWATGDLTGHEEMLKAGLDPADFSMVYVLSESEFHFAFSRDVPDTLVSAFQHAIQLIRSQPDAHGVTEYERIIYKYLGVGYARQTFSDETVWALINNTAAAVQADASDTIRRVNAGESPYLDPLDHGLYVFIYDANVTLLGNAGNPLMSGVNMRGKTDVTGMPFRDIMVAGALANGTGSVDYVYMNPTMTNLYYKTTYYKLVSGNDGQQYIICCGNYKARG